MLSYNVLNSWVEKMMKKDLPVKIKTSDITSLSTKDINKLKAGDIVLKKTGNQKHTYIVGYKENNQGICLTYTDATVIETVSYDYDTTTKTWVYNSTDIGRVGGVEYTAGDGISIVDGVISNTKKVYKYTFQFNSFTEHWCIKVFSSVNANLEGTKTVAKFISEILSSSLYSNKFYDLITSGYYTDSESTEIHPLYAYIDSASNCKVVAHKKTSAEATPSQVTVHDLTTINVSTNYFKYFKEEL